MNPVSSARSARPSASSESISLLSPWAAAKRSAGPTPFPLCAWTAKSLLPSLSQSVPSRPLPKPSFCSLGEFHQLGLRAADDGHELQVFLGAVTRLAPAAELC